MLRHCKGLYDPVLMNKRVSFKPGHLAIKDPSQGGAVRSFLVLSVEGNMMTCLLTFDDNSTHYSKMYSQIEEILLVNFTILT